MQLINQLYNSPPKNSYQLGLILEVSSRSVYRYLELLELSGFDIKKNQKNQYYIDSSREIPEVTFTDLVEVIIIDSFFSHEVIIID